VKRSRLDAIDLRIIRALQHGSRQPVAKLAKALRLPDSTVRHRIAQLTREKLIEFSVASNPLHFGYQTWTIMEIKAELPKIRDVARSLAQMPEVYFVSIMSGAYDINAAAVFRSNEELVDFITRRLSKIPGIVSTTTATVLELVKRTMSFQLPETTVRNGRPDRGQGIRR
jgi:Lrp/AsnC family transcriptional regulator for asnA, asnC and gidA